MQPGPPYPPQPPMGQPGQPYPAPGYQPQGYPQQPGYQQPSYPQPGYPQPGFGQSPMPGMPGPRKPKTGLIVLIVVIALVVVGGGTTALILLTKGKDNPTNVAGGTSTPAAPSTTVNNTAVGRYQTPVSCSKLNGGPFEFEPTGPITSGPGLTIGSCPGIAHTGDASTIGMSVMSQIFTGPGGVAKAEMITTSDNAQGSQRVSGNGFEQPVYFSFSQGNCFVEWARSNENVRLQFLGLPGATDTPSCQSAAMPYATQYYPIIG